MRSRALLCAAIVLCAAACGRAEDDRARAPAAQASVQGGQPQASTPSPCTGFGVPPIVQKPALSGDFSSVGDQLGADCMAWQSFIALNWRADPANPGLPDTTAGWGGFGDPADESPTVWESYWEPAEVFNQPVGARLLWSSPRPAGKRLVRRSKLDDADLTLIGFQQAGDHKWLTAQDGSLTYYEVRINQDEFDYITTNVINGSDLTTFAGQAACAAQAGRQGRGGFNLPVGGGNSATAVNDADCMGTPRTYGRNVGSIEIKAAWRVLPANGSLNGRYLTAQAQIVDPATGRATPATVGLTGLHILRRVPGAQQFVWSTFEQIDNSPDQGSTPDAYSNPVLPANPNQKPGPGYTYYNPGCSRATDTIYSCVHNQLPDSACAVGQTGGCDPYPAPMQVTRVTPVDPVANSVTGYVWSVLPANSVFNYYRLVNVQWPANSTATAPRSTTPLTRGDITPAANVANTTMETFLQTSGNANNCMSCHQQAPIAQPAEQSVAMVAGRRLRTVRLLASSREYASSYSFIFATETRH
jgi:hypothetical protein